MEIKADYNMENMYFLSLPFAILHASFIFVFICYRYESPVAQVSNGTQLRFLTATNMYNRFFRSYSYYEHIRTEINFLPILIKCVVALSGHLLSIQFDCPTHSCGNCSYSILKQNFCYYFKNGLKWIK